MPHKDEVKKVMSELAHDNMSRGFAEEFVKIFGASDKTIHQYNQEVTLNRHRLTATVTRNNI